MSKPNRSKPPHYLRERDLLEIFPFSRPTLYRRMRAGKFPRPVKIGPRLNAWIADEIAEHQEQIAAERIA
jgi:prophage regulatory protein